MQTPVIVLAAALALGIASAANAADTQGPQRTILQTFDVPGTNYQTIIGLSEIGPNKSSGRQSHPGPEGGYVLEGTGSIAVDGKPLLSLKAGQSYRRPSGVEHDVMNGSPHPIAFIEIEIKRPEELGKAV